LKLEFANALEGIKKLPVGVKLGVYSAYLYYQGLFKKIKRLKIKELDESACTCFKHNKASIFLRGLLEIKILKLT
jgi:phytoene synthase